MPAPGPLRALPAVLRPRPNPIGSGGRFIKVPLTMIDQHSENGVASRVQLLYGHHYCGVTDGRRWH